MLSLGFVTAILPDLSLEEVARFAKDTGYDALEVMCWPPGKAERRYAGVTHIDVVDFKEDDAKAVQETMASIGVTISGLGYYPNPLVADEAEAQVYVEHIRRVISAAKLLGIPVVNTFIGRDHTKSVDENWPRFLEVWKPLIAFADDNGIKIGIENCPMSFTRDEWPEARTLRAPPRSGDGCSTIFRVRTLALTSTRRILYSSTWITARHSASLHQEFTMCTPKMSASTTRSSTT
jgi:sugar phosphate isomerase/epimerase